MYRKHLREVAATPSESQSILGWKGPQGSPSPALVNGPYGKQTHNLGIICTTLQPTGLEVKN